MQLPLVDPRDPIDAQAQTIAVAAEQHGFFRIPLNSVDRTVADRAWNDARAFFAQPEDRKRQVEFPETGYPYGYSPFGFERLARSIDQDADVGPDLKESFSVGPDCGPPVPLDNPWIRSPSLWPSDPPSLRQSWTDYYLAMAGIAARLMTAMAVALQIPETYFDSLIDRPISSMRALHYPSVDELGAHPNSLRAGAHPTSLRAGAHPTSLRAGAHSDYGTLTILRTDDVPGLEIQSADGSWKAVDPDPNTFVVNLGDSIAQWTNDRWRSTMHRVNATDPAARFSMAFFHMANWDATIECLPTCLAPGERPRHQPVQAGPWLMQKFQSTV